ncbi:MAG: hypothetical protein AAGA30_12345 [Planctomycetota bacterium]
METEEFNPYAAPQTTEVAADELGSDAEQLRRYCLSHETSIKSISLLYYLGGGFVLFSLMFGGMGVITSLFFMAIAVFQLSVAYGLRRLHRLARIGGTILSVFSLLSIPIGTIIGGYMLYLLWSKKGQIVFSDRYWQVIRETPHIRYKTPLVIRILVWMLVSIILIGLLLFGIGSVI